mmetsp:Transcript_22288/g.50993  ORF Transcript_22288/g.50993 Transcript_22288/m.50993 type:complete len:519 (-) Transcript_22288:113-1669(-)
MSMLSFYTQVESFISSSCSSVGFTPVASKGMGEAKKREKESIPLVLLLVALILVVAPFDLAQLLFAFVGIVVCLLVSQPQSSTKPKVTKKVKDLQGPLIVAESTAHITGQAKRPPVKREAGADKGPEYRKLSTNPVPAPTFTADGYEDAVEELLGQIAPSSQGDKVVQELVRRVEQTLKPFIPEAEVVGFAGGDLTRGTAFGVAVPEVDVVVNVPLSVLCTRMQGRLSMMEGRQPAPAERAVDERKLQKSAIRACTDRLVAQGGFKFRRSAFRGQEPKVTLLAPVGMGVHSEAIPIDFSVNIMTPLYNATLLAECGRLAPPAKALILMVKRWAKDRGVCHAAKGHLSPYSWSLATVFFLQVGVDEPLLPALQGFVNSEGKILPKPLSGGASKETGKWSKTTGQLFKDFITFYSSEFKWQEEVLSIQTGQRQKHCSTGDFPTKDLSGGEEAILGVHIEDPFEPMRNLGACMTETSFGRLQEELTRAAEICSRDCTLTELLTPWVPPERTNGDVHDADEN